MGLPACHAPRAIPVGGFHRRLEPLLDQPQHVGINNTAGNRLHQLPVWDGIEILAQIGIDHIGVTPPKQGQHQLDRLGRTASRPIAVRRRFQVRLEDRLQHQLRRSLHHPVPNRWNAEWPLAAAGLRDHHPSHRLALIRLRTQLLTQPDQPVLQPCRLDLLERRSVHPWRTFVGTRQVIRVAQDVRPPDLVVAQVEPETRLGLRLAIELSLQSPDRFRCCQAHRQSPHLVCFENVPEVRVLPSTGITRLQRYYDPVRLPHRPAPHSAVEAATLVACGSPPLARSPVSTCCAHYPGGPVQVHLSAASPHRAAFPTFWLGRRPQLPFRGLLRLYTRYGPSIRSTAQGGLCRRASTRPVTQPHRLPATGPTDHYPGGTFTH